VKAGGRTVGVITSSGFSPALGGPLALAVVKRPFNAAQTELVVNGQSAETVELPVSQR